MNKINNLKQTPGTYEKSFVNSTNIEGQFKDIQLTNIDSASFESDKNHMISGGVKYLEKGFLESDTEVVKATAVFDTFLWPQESLANFGNDKIEFLAYYFQSQIFPGCDFATSKHNKLQSLMAEWYEFKILGQRLPIQELIQKANWQEKTDFQYWATCSQ